MLGVVVALGREEQLAATELHFIELRRLGITLYDAVERRKRRVGLAGGLVGTRELVEHLIIAGVVRISLEERRVEVYRLGSLQIYRGDLLFEPLHLSGVEIQIA